jgi:hypothetical protein
VLSLWSGCDRDGVGPDEHGVDDLEDVGRRNVGPDSVLADLLPARCLAEARAQGEIRADEDPERLAFELDAFVLEGNTFFVLHDDPAYLHYARTAIARRLELATQRAPNIGRRLPKDG